MDNSYFRLSGSARATEHDKKRFIKIDLRVKSSSGFISPKTFIYQPEEGNLQAGTHYSYTITVNKERLVIQQISGQWDDNNGSEYADEEVCRVNLPEGHGQTLTFSSNVTTEHDNEKNIDYLLVRGKEFYISYDLTDANSMKGFIPTVEDTNKITVNCSESKGVYTFRYTLKYQTVNLIYDDYVQVGDIYYSDGTWSRNKNEDKIPVGIVFRSGAAGTEDLPNYYGWAPTRIIRGYVVALADASTRKGCWGYGTNNKYLTTSYEEASSLKEGQRTKYYSGYVNTNKLRTEDPDGLYSKADVNSVSTGLWAFKVAVEYRPANIPDGDPAAPTENNGSSGWYLPSIRQLIDLANLFRLNVYLQAAGGNPFDYYANEYWSSSEYPNTKTASTNAYINRIAEMKTNWKMKTAQCYVRSVLTF